MVKKFARFLCGSGSWKIDWRKTIIGSLADVNLDGKVNAMDLGVMMSGWE